MSKKVALALSSGGPRGFAYIGAIEVLLERGYEITSVSGASAGSLVGGIYAAGGLEEFKQWLFSLDPVKVLTMLDFSVSRNYLVKGEKLIETIKEKVPAVNIEDLPIPFAAVATDLYTGEEVVFRSGPLFNAIRASISLPSMFRPVQWEGHTLIDGGIANTFPLNRVARQEGDILVGFNVNEINATDIRAYLKSEAALVEDLRDTLSGEATLLKRIRQMGEIGKEIIEGKRTGRENEIPVSAADNYITILQRSFGIMNHTIARYGIALNPPDILVSMPFDSYHGVYGYTHAREITERGRLLMTEALDKFESR